MITGVTIKHFAYCPQIVKLESMGFEERVTEAMREGEGIDKEKVINFLYGILKPLNIVKKPTFTFKDLVGSPDYVLTFLNHWSPLDIKAGSKRYDHKLQIKYYMYLMDLNGINVKEGLLYYTSSHEVVKVRYSYAVKREVEGVIEKAREAMKGEVRVVQKASKCFNCGFYTYCRPKIKGGIAFA
jgi:CRISPR-associated exonuclease Cas4